MSECCEKPAITVVMPARNEGARLHATIDSIVAARSCLFPLQVVVVDDDSSDGCSASLEGMYSWSRDYVRVDVLRLPQWSGIPYARNLGAGAAHADILFITDANVRFPSCWDIRVREHIGSNRVLCATIADEGSPFRGYGGALHIPTMGFSWLKSPTAYGGYVPLSPCTGTVISRELFRRAGGYDSAMLVYGAAEEEFSVRLWLSGAEIICVPDLILQHRFRPSSERRPFLDAIARLFVHNYLRFGLLYLDQPRALQLFQHYAASKPNYFEGALRRVWASDVWHRRNLLRRRLPLHFESFVKRFGLIDAGGSLTF